MPGRTPSATRVNFARMVGVLAVLVGILLLQSTLCDGPTAADPCGAECAASVLGSADLQMGGETPAHVTLIGADESGGLDDHSGLATLCMTILIAVLLALAGLRRPGSAAAAPMSTVVYQASSALSRAMRRERLCVQRL